jgi:hypothetical protein
VFTGVVIEADSRTNALTGRPFVWALVETLGGTFDVVIAPETRAAPPSPGEVLCGVFWLSVRIVRP